MVSLARIFAFISVPLVLVIVTSLLLWFYLSDSFHEAQKKCLSLWASVIMIIIRLVLMVHFDFSPQRCR